MSMEEENVQQIKSFNGKNAHLEAKWPLILLVSFECLPTHTF
jgi:hypothetical protein